MFWPDLHRRNHTVILVKGKKAKPLLKHYRTAFILSINLLPPVAVWNIRQKEAELIYSIAHFTATLKQFGVLTDINNTVRELGVLCCHSLCIICSSVWCKYSASCRRSTHTPNLIKKKKCLMTLPVRNMTQQNSDVDYSSKCLRRCTLAVRLTSLSIYLICFQHTIALNSSSRFQLSDCTNISPYFHTFSLNLTPVTVCLHRCEHSSITVCPLPLEQDHQLYFHSPFAKVLKYGWT